ncbi:hypothetical protein [Paenibacillus ginsengihumi]|nr:hypothetical protein [Paenibacillus ginsengihumi]
MKKVKQPSYMKRKEDGPNVKLIAWVGGGFAAIVILMAVLLIVNQ